MTDPKQMPERITAYWDIGDDNPDGWGAHAGFIIETDKANAEYIRADLVPQVDVIAVAHHIAHHMVQCSDDGVNIDDCIDGLCGILNAALGRDEG